jgi:hypothetical protein
MIVFNNEEREMFVCEFSGEVSDEAVVKFVEKSHYPDGMKVMTKVVERPAEKPLRVVIQKRLITYVDGQTGNAYAEGSEIVQELMIRAKHLDAVKKKYGLE